MSENIHVGDIGTVVEVQFVECGTPVDISTATSTQIAFRNPNGIVVVVTAVFTGTEAGDGTDGRIRWTSTTSTDWDISGEWTIQAKVVLTGGATFRSEKKNFQVDENISDDLF